MPIVLMSDPIIVPLPVYYGTSDTRYGQAGFPKPAFFYIPRPRQGLGDARMPLNLTKGAGFA
jgi:hypothetical protein